MNKKYSRYFVLGSLFLFFLAGQAFAGLSQIIAINVDENGNGTISGFLGTEPLPSGLLNDPGPDGLNNALTYDLLNPPGLTAGDVLVVEGGVISDIIRFNPQQTGPGGGLGTLVFYSDNLDGADALADIGLPLFGYTNWVLIPEIGAEGSNAALYIPTAGQPGFVEFANGRVQYTFISDSPSDSPTIPEPSTFLLLGAGLAGIGIMRRKFRK